MEKLFAILILIGATVLVDCNLVGEYTLKFANDNYKTVSTPKWQVTLEIRKINATRSYTDYQIYFKVANTLWSTLRVYEKTGKSRFIDQLAGTRMLPFDKEDQLAEQLIGKLHKLYKGHMVYSNYLLLGGQNGLTLGFVRHLKKNDNKE